MFNFTSSAERGSTEVRLCPPPLLRRQQSVQLRGEQGAAQEQQDVLVPVHGQGRQGQEEEHQVLDQQDRQERRQLQVLRAQRDKVGQLRL